MQPSAILRFVSVAMLAGCAASSFAQGSLVEQGRGAIARSAPDSAITILERAVAEAPQDAEAHYLLAVAHGRKALASGLIGKLRHVKQARLELGTAIALDPRHVEARMMSLQADLAMPGIMGGSRRTTRAHSGSSRRRCASTLATWRPTITSAAPPRWRTRTSPWASNR